MCSYFWDTTLATLQTLSAILLFGAATAGHGLTIVPTFDASIANDPDGPAMMSAIKAAILEIETNIVDRVTVRINFVNDPQTELAHSETDTSPVPYSDYLAQLKAAASSALDSKAASVFADSAVDPVRKGRNIVITPALARVMGLESSPPPEFDSIVHFNMTAFNFTRPGEDPDKYDLQSTALHEIDEVLGFQSSLPDDGEIAPIDLFRYDSSGKRTLSTTASEAYFSVDGKTLLARFNQDPEGDFSDWWSDGDLYWSPPGTTPRAQAQDAFATPGVFEELGPNELAALDIIGWTLAGNSQPLPPSITIVLSGQGQVTLSWSRDVPGFVLQTSANLSANAWTDAPTGAANPAVIPIASGRQFFQLYKAPAVRALAVHSAASSPDHVAKRSIRRR